MPLYYDTTNPQQGNKNSITRSATDFGIRDFLLHRNIQNPIRYPQLSTSYNGSPHGGEPFTDTVQGSNAVIQQVSIEVDGIFRYESAIAMNLFKDTDNITAGQLIDVENVLTQPIFPTPPQGLGNYSQEDFSQFGLLAKSDSKSFRKLATIKNLYLDATKQIDIADYISLQPIGATQQLGSYADEYGHLNIGDSSTTQALDIAGSLLNGQGVGFANNSVVTNFDIRSSLAGRILGATGTIQDTPLGIIGGQQLVLALANNAAFNVEHTLLGTLNIADNVLSLVKGNGLTGLRPNYTITIPGGTGGQVLSYAEKVLGFYVPRSFLQDGGSLFSSENGHAANIQRANSMLENTGQGQVKVLTDLMNSNLQSTSIFKSGYAPAFQIDAKNIINPFLYAYYNNGNILKLLDPQQSGDTIPDITYNRSKMIDDNFAAPTNALSAQDYYGNTFGASNSHIKTPTFSWGSNNNDVSIVNVADNYNFIQAPDKRTLLGKTQLLFNSKGMKTIVSAQGDLTGVGIAGSQIQTSVFQGAISKGSAVLAASNFDVDGRINTRPVTGSSAENTYCRTWTTFHRYDRVNRLIRSRGVNQSEGSAGNILGAPWRMNYKNGSVLDDNGFVKVVPYKTDNLTRQADNPKKYMFSIENLAWVGNPALNLPAVEQGPGDLLTGKFGRIMWFPPYDLNFTETTSVSLESNLFIGRGEPLYTYNNAERTGNLTFKVIVDHPSIMNAFKGNSSVTDEFIDSWLSGCLDLDSKWSDLLTTDEKAYQANRNVVKTNPVTVTPVTINPKNFKIYFKNDSTDVDIFYEAAPAGSASFETSYSSNIQITNLPNSRGICTPVTGRFTHWSDPTSAGLNSNSQPITIGSNSFPSSWTTPGFFAALTTYLSDPQFKDYTINITVGGYASAQGCQAQNLILAQGRVDNTVAFLKSQLGSVSNTVKYVKQTVGSSSVINTTNYTNNPVVSPQSGLGPKSDRYALVTFSIDYTQTQTVQPVQHVDSNTVRNLNPLIKQRFYNEGIFFEKLQQTDPFVFDKISEKLRFFHPAFHSVTPEGFNSRLTFLLQCTRQGPTIPGVQANNLAFGPAPVCILRIGDFYNTKIMIDSVNFDFQEPQWDLNPEGIGVQPMIAQVNISFKYIGGSSLQSPINKLQNALTFNFFANTQMYDPRSDYVAKASDVNATNNNNDFANKRNTFNSNSLEDNYALVLGLDPTSVPYEKNPSTVPTNTANDGKNIDQTQTAAATNGTTKPTLTGRDQDIQVLALPSTQIHFTTQNGVNGLTYNIVKSAQANLSQDYNFDTNVQEVNDIRVNYFHSFAASIIAAPTDHIAASDKNKTMFIPFTDFVPAIPDAVITDPFNYIVSIRLNGVNDGRPLPSRLKGNINKT